MHRSTDKARGPHQRHSDVSGGKVEDRGQAGLRDYNPRHHNVNLAPLDMLASVQGEPVASVANVLDVPKPRYENIRHLVRVDKQIRLLNFYKHDALPSRARREGECPNTYRARSSSAFHSKAPATGYCPLNATPTQAEAA